MGTIQPTFSRIWVYLAGLSACLEILENAVLLIIRYWKLPKIQTGIFGLIRLKQDKARQGNILFWVLSGDDATSLPPPTPARSQAKPSVNHDAFRYAFTRTSLARNVLVCSLSLWSNRLRLILNVDATVILMCYPTYHTNDDLYFGFILRYRVWFVRHQRF